MLGGINQRRAHRDDISQFYSIVNKKIMRKCPSSFKNVQEDHVVDHEQDYEQDKNDAEEADLFIQPFQAEVFTYSKDYLNLKLESSHHIDFWVVPSQQDVDMILEGGDFDYNSELSKQKIREHTATGYVSPGSFVVFANRTAHLATVKLSSDNF
ncbi:MAG: hypothetical protein R6U44_10575 [Archaeoglobaceae archaeon]